MKCVSGKHEWTDPDDAAKCCRPDWQRCVQVGMVDGIPWFSHYWRAVDPDPKAERKP
jgi:hypothetical protein